MAMGAKPWRDLVDLVGIEPTTSSMPWKRAPSCATGPLVKGRTASILADSYRLVKQLREFIARVSFALHVPFEPKLRNL